MFGKSDTRDQIVEAAKTRFSHYGYDKTTMAELARDCNMSPGNLYRFFPGKLDIAEAIAQGAEDERFKQAQELVRQDGVSPPEKLRALLFFELRETFYRLESQPRAIEIAQIIAKERPDFSNRAMHRARSLIAEILAAGNADGSFDISDIVFAAEMIQSATMKFDFPQLWSRLSLDKLERELDGVLNLIVGGLRGPNLKKPPLVAHECSEII